MSDKKPTPGPAQRTAGKQDAFLEAYARLGNIAGAARAAGIERVDHYRWLEKDAAYTERFTQAEDEAADMLEQEARRRAMLGSQRPVFHKGEIVGHLTEYSDTLLIFLMKGARPQKYRERVDVESKVEITAAKDLVERLARGRQRAAKKGPTK
jgi:hypothetical protein